MITLPMGAVAKYCDEYVFVCVCVCVCVCVRLSTRISPEPLAIFTNFSCMLPMSVARSSSDRVTKSLGEGRGSFGGFFPTDNALYSIAFGTHIKTAQPIEMLFGMMTRVGHRYCALDGEPDPPRGRGNFGEHIAAHC